MIWTDNDIHDDLTHEVIVHCTDMLTYIYVCCFQWHFEMQD